MKQGILIAFGEIFLKSPGVQRIFRRKLQNNLSFFLKKEGVDFRIFPHRERIFVETKEQNKARKIIKNVFGISWFAKSFFLKEEP
jgi:adenylyl- and sulfurtransferase ThiI